MKGNLLFFVFFISLTGVFGQDQILPHYPTASEVKSMKAYIDSKYSSSLRSVPLPPPGPVRTMAEWEQIQALVITWAGQATILREIVRNAVKECKVLIITNSPTTVSGSLTNAGIPLDSVQFVNTNFNSIWVRDYGPWTVYKNDVDSLFLIDWIYNRPRPADDATPAAIAQHLSIPFFEAITDPDDLVHTGGNHLPDGMGTVLSSMLVLEENPDKTEEQIDSIGEKYLGVNEWIKFPTLPYDGIHHVDMHIRMLDEETIMFGEYPEGIADGPQINANIDYLKEEFQTPFGNPYKIVRIPMPPEGDRYPHQGGDYRTYTNSIFINKTILVPTYEEQYDTTALRIYRENLPGYNVVGINCNSIISSLGALHCITKLVGTDDPLFIAHPRLRDSEDPQSEYLVKAIIKHRSGINLAKLFYRTSEDSVYTEVPMALLDTIQNLWASVIPPFPAGTEVQYYISARSNSGKEQVRPIVAPEGYFRFNIHGELVNQPPMVRITSPLEGSVFDIYEDGLDIDIDADDNDGEIEELVVFINGDSTALITVEPYVYHWEFPGLGEYEITARARDNQGAETMSEPVNISVENTTGIKEADNEIVKAFPNPVRDVLWMKYKEEIQPGLIVSNFLGQAVILNRIEDGDLFGYDFSGLAAGIYFIHYRDSETGNTIRVIKL